MFAWFSIPLDPILQGQLMIAVPATIASIAAWRSASAARKHTETTNGHTTGELAEKTHDLLTNHISDSWLHRGY